MIDRFQDANPQRYRIFDTIYGGEHTESGFAICGDPKTSHLRIS